MSSVNRQIPLRIGLEDDARFDNFYAASGSNSELLAYLQSDRPDVLYLYGNSSSGVSHLLIALAKQAESAGQKTQYIPIKELMDAPAEILRQLGTLELLCIDDIDLATLSEEWQLEIFHLFNRLREQGGRLVFGSHSAPTELAIGLADLRSRVLSGQTWAVAELEDVDKLSALKKRAELRGFDLSETAAAYLLRHQKRDMSNLMKHLDHLDRLSLEEKKLITLPLVKQLLKK